MKNRKREICTSGTVRDEGGNILIYSARRDEAHTHLYSRRPKSAKARNRGVWAPTVQRALWGFGVCGSVRDVTPKLAVGSL
jgi:hypothetical protein